MTKAILELEHDLKSLPRMIIRISDGVSPILEPGPRNESFSQSLV